MNIIYLYQNSKCKYCGMVFFLRMQIYEFGVTSKQRTLVAPFIWSKLTIT